MLAVMFACKNSSDNVLQSKLVDYSVKLIEKCEAPPLAEDKLEPVVEEVITDTVVVAEKPFVNEWGGVEEYKGLIGTKVVIESAMFDAINTDITYIHYDGSIKTISYNNVAELHSKNPKSRDVSALLFSISEGALVATLDSNSRITGIWRLSNNDNRIYNFYEHLEFDWEEEEYLGFGSHDDPLPEEDED